MEEIIIDGVDVAGCDNLYEKDDMICVDNGIEESCQGNNCYYKQLKRTQNVLQEIKAIAETASPYIDNFEIKTATEVGYDYAAICNELELRLHKVLELITKAEEE